MKTFLTSDLHIDHAKITDYREGSWDSVEDHNEDLITRWNETVSPQDTVFVLGDFALGQRAKSVPKAKLLHGRKIIIPGNHDSLWSGYSRTKANLDDRMRLYRDADLLPFPERLDLVVADHAVTMSHFPFQGEGKGKEDPDKEYISMYYDYMPADRGQWLLHGHVHDAWKVKGRQINVGVDVWDLRPVALDEIVAIMDHGDLDD